MKTKNTLATCLFCLPLLTAFPAQAALYSFDLTGAMSGQFAVIDFTSELGLAPGTDVNITGIGWDFSVTTTDPLGIGEAGFGFGDVVSIFVRRPNNPLTVTSSVDLFYFSDFGDDPVSIGSGDVILTLETWTQFLNEPGHFYFQPDAVWSGELTIDVASAVPLPGALVLLLSAVAGLLGFRQRPQD